MKRYGSVAAVVVWAGVAWGAGPATVKSPEVRLCEKAGLNWHPGALERWLRVRSDARVAGQARKWVSRLGNESFAAREEASAKLKLLGELALPELERARTAADDLETRRRAERLVRQIEAGRPDRLFLRPLDWAVVRLLGRTGTTREAAEALVAYVPCAMEDETVEALYEALDRLHARGLAGEALRGALKSEDARTRALAGCVLGKSDDAAEREAARPLLRDRDAGVRLRTAQGLLAAMRPGREALPVLVELLGEESRAVAWQAEELLRFAAGPGSPEEVLGSHEAKRRERVRAAWRAWWRANAAIDLTRLHASGRRPGLVMVHVAGERGQEIPGPIGEVVNEAVQVVGCDGKVRWQREWKAERNVSEFFFRPSGEMLRGRQDGQAVLEYLAADGSMIQKIDPGEENPFPRLRMWPRARLLIGCDERIMHFDPIAMRQSFLQEYERELAVAQKGYPNCGTYLDIDGRPLFLRTRARATKSEKIEKVEPRRGNVDTSAIEARTMWVGNTIYYGIWRLPAGEMFGCAHLFRDYHRLVQFDGKGDVRRVLLPVRNSDECGPLGVLPNGDVLVLGEGVCEIDAEGRVVWHAPLKLLARSGVVLYPLVRFGFRPLPGTKRPDCFSQETLVERLRDPDTEVRRWTMDWLYYQVETEGARDWAVGAAATERMLDGYPKVRDWAGGLLADPDSGECIPRYRWGTVFDLLEVGGYHHLERCGSGVIDPLIRRLERLRREKKPGDPRLGWTLRPAAQVAIVYRDERVVEAMRGSLRLLAPAEARDVMGIMRSSRHHEVYMLTRANAQARFVRRSDSLFAPLLPELLEWAKHADAETAAVADDAIKSLGDAAEAAVPVYLKMLEKPETRARALRVLGSICGSHEEKVRKVLCEAVGPDQPIEEVRAALGGLLELGAQPEVIESFRRALRDTRSSDCNLMPVHTVRQEALLSLIHLGPKAQLLRQDVERIWRDPVARARYPTMVEYAQDVVSGSGIRSMLTDEIRSFLFLKQVSPSIVLLDLIDNHELVREFERQAFLDYETSVAERRDLLRESRSKWRLRAALILGAMARRMGRMPETVWRFARSREVQSLHREYALRALGVYGSAEARAYLVRVADDATESDQIRAVARRALAMPTTASP